MADSPADIAAGSYSKDIDKDIDGKAEFQNGDVINWLSDISQSSSGYTELCKSVFQNGQDDNSTPDEREKAEDGQSEAEGSGDGWYIDYTPNASSEVCYGSPIAFTPSVSSDDVYGSPIAFTPSVSSDNGYGSPIAYTPDASTEACYGSPAPPLSSSVLSEAAPENSLTESFTPTLQDIHTETSSVYSSSADLHCLAESRHKGEEEDVPCGPPPYCSYWRAHFRGATPPVVYTASSINTLLTPPDSPQPPSRVTRSADFLDAVKACVASAVRAVVLRKIKKDCYGCEIDHPSQRQHACLYPPECWYFSLNFEPLMADLLSWEFIPALKSTLEKMGLSVPEGRIEGAADAFLYDLKSEENILEKVEEIIKAYADLGRERELLLDHFIEFWNP